MVGSRIPMPGTGILKSDVGQGRKQDRRRLPVGREERRGQRSGDIVGSMSIPQSCFQCLDGDAIAKSLSITQIDNSGNHSYYRLNPSCNCIYLCYNMVNYRYNYINQGHS